MREPINAEFEAYVKSELGDIAVVSEGRYISPKIQNYYKVWQHLQAQLADAQKDAARWIPLGERLPDEGESVYVFSKHGQSDTADFIMGAFENCWLTDDAEEALTHWAPKPPVIAAMQPREQS